MNNDDSLPNVIQGTFMTILTWHGKEDAVKKARKTPYRLLREVAKFSHNFANQPTNLTH